MNQAQKQTSGHDSSLASGRMASGTPRSARGSCSRQRVWTLGHQTPRSKASDKTCLRSPIHPTGTYRNIACKARDSCLHSDAQSGGAKSLGPRDVSCGWGSCLRRVDARKTAWRFNAHLPGSRQLDKVRLVPRQLASQLCIKTARGLTRLFHHIWLP